MTLAQDQVYERLRTVLDPETRINIVDMGLIYDVWEVVEKSTPTTPHFHILYTLTTPACPLAGTIQMMVWDAFRDLESEVFRPEHNLTLELTFDPPWITDMMSEEAKAEMGF